MDGFTFEVLGTRFSWQLADQITCQSLKSFACTAQRAGLKGRRCPLSMCTDGSEVLDKWVTLFVRLSIALVLSLPGKQSESRTSLFGTDQVLRALGPWNLFSNSFVQFARARSFMRCGIGEQGAQYANSILQHAFASQKEGGALLAGCPEAVQASREQVQKRFNRPLNVNFRSVRRGHTRP